MSYQLAGQWPQIAEQRDWSPAVREVAGDAYRFDLPDGWADLFGRLDRQLADLAEQCGVELRYLQVKQKFARLRVYLQLGEGPSRFAEQAHQLIEQAATISAGTCEDCGGPGRPRRDGGWQKVQCEACHGG